MRVIKAKNVAVKEIKTKEGSTLYKGAYETQSDVFIAYSTKEPAYAEEYNFVIVDGKYKRIDI